MDCSAGSKPSHVWKNILFGRDLLCKGLLKVIGNGVHTRALLDNWILDGFPRAPKTRDEILLDLTLKVSDLMIPHTSLWDRTLLQQTFVEEDVQRIFQIPISPYRDDDTTWCYSHNEVYTSKSGYKLAEKLMEIETEYVSLPSLEKKLWSDLWKTKTSPKIRHFLWKILAGALVVKERLQARHIPVDALCPLCNETNETISHMLFHCLIAKEVWELSHFPIPNGGFSTTSMFINLYHILKEMKSSHQQHSDRKRAPWLLWHIWKGRNEFNFNQTRMEAQTIVDKAHEDCEEWFSVNTVPVATRTNQFGDALPQVWLKPEPNALKCNFGSSWISHDINSGASWMVRNFLGEALRHGRRSFSRVISNLDADLLGLWWVLQSTWSLRQQKIYFETSSQLVIEAIRYPNRFPNQRGIIICINSFLQRFADAVLTYNVDSSNRVANEIAASVTSLQMYQSYIGHGGPIWLANIIRQEAQLN